MNRYRVWLADRITGHRDERPAYPNVVARDAQAAAEYWAMSFFHGTPTGRVPGECSVWVQRDGQSARDRVLVRARYEVHFDAEPIA